MLENGALSQLVVITCSCLNSRTASRDARNVNPVDEIYEMNSDNYSESRMPVGNGTRTSKDSTVNSFGRHLTGICEEFGLSVLNAQYLNFSHARTHTHTHIKLCDYIFTMLWFIALWVCENCFNCGYMGENLLLFSCFFLKCGKVKLNEQIILY